MTGNTICPEDRTPGVILGAAGLAGLERRYGLSELAPRTYSGSVEQGVLATYHHAGHSYHFIHDMFRYAVAANRITPGTYGATGFIRFPIIGAYHDAIMGYGRAVDEYLSADMAAEMMTTLGFTLLPDEPAAMAILGTARIADNPAHAAIVGTTWNPELRRQAVNPNSPFAPYQRAAAVADLMPLFDRRGPYQAICLFVEDMCKVMNGRLFQRVALQNGFDYTSASVDTCMDFIDAVPVLGDKFGELLRAQADFFASFQPADPRLDAMFPGRADNIAFMRQLSELYDARHTAATPMTARRALLASRDFMTLAA